MEAEGEDGFINRVLNMPAFYGVERIDLSIGNVVNPRIAHYFIAHFGLINIITSFKNSKYVFDAESQVFPEGGHLFIPENNQRQRRVPPGVWTLFVKLAQEFQVDWLTRTTKAVERYSQPAKQKPSKEREDLFGIVSATEKDFSNMKLQTEQPIEVPKEISFLPKNFKVSRVGQQSCIQLPSSHRILLHYLIPYNEVEETLFLCVGSGGEYILQRPYIIYHYFKNGYQFSSGFFVSADDLTAQEFLPETREFFEVNNCESVSYFRQHVHKLLPTVLREKGFYSMASLLYRIHDG